MYVIHQPRFVLKQGRFSLRFLASFQGLCKISNIFYFHPSSFHLHLGEQTKHIPPNHQPLRTKKTTPLIFHDQRVCFPISLLTWLQESGTWITSTINQPTGHPLPLPTTSSLSLERSGAVTKFYHFPWGVYKFCPPKTPRAGNVAIFKKWGGIFDTMLFCCSWVIFRQTFIRTLVPHSIWSYRILVMMIRTTNISLIDKILFLSLMI